MTAEHRKEAAMPGNEKVLALPNYPGATLPSEIPPGGVFG
jgi:hypothetical protein